MPLSVLRRCPNCAREVDVRKAWWSVPKTRMGLPSGYLTYGTPALRCPHCLRLCAMRTWRLSIFTIALWVSIIAAGWYIGDHSPGDGAFVVTAVALVAGGLVIQWLFAPMLIF